MELSWTTSFLLIVASGPLSSLLLKTPPHLGLGCHQTLPPKYLLGLLFMNSEVILSHFLKTLATDPVLLTSLAHSSQNFW